MEGGGVWYLWWGRGAFHCEGAVVVVVVVVGVMVVG